MAGSFGVTRCYTIPDEESGGTMRVSLRRPPDPKTVQALQDLARIVRKSAKERGVEEVTPEFQVFLNARGAE